ncbi:hypothetical protein [Clavibacter nebraskensis]|uniref:hypothetical protein n=1 Tax=Clavibacter nebraskensis TaxID=31963 RepID=UPI00200BAF4A|nr:hypothetical protein [Clavibacter nebraskensis]UQB14586.1 hypothetical protein LIX20_001208 [Clavibacter nebraskensis]UQB17418.1 hypothetical protein LIX22_001207 [Clavibacter nebraskensis]
MSNEFGTLKQAKLLLFLKGKAREPLPNRMSPEEFIERAQKTPQSQIQEWITHYNDKLGWIPTVSPSTLTQIKYIWDLRAKLGKSNKVGAPTVKDLTYAEADLLIRELRAQVAAAKHTTEADETVAQVIDIFSRRPAV